MRLLFSRNQHLCMVVLLACIVCVGCGDRKSSSEDRSLRVRALKVVIEPQARRASLTGEFRARYQSDLAFRVGGRIATRRVDVGDHVAAGDVLAVLDTQEQMADIEAAKATLRSAEATLKQASSNVSRIERLVESQAASQQEFDDAKAAFLTAQGSVDIGKSTILTAEGRLAYTEIRADAPGIIIARNAEAGQVVNAAQTVFTLAYDGEREAVFDVFQTHVAEKPVDGQIDITLVSNPSIQTVGFVREIAPAIDETNGTVRVKVGISSPPPQMSLGSPVIGFARFPPRNLAELPWTAMSRQGDDPAVWVIDPVTSTASSRVVTIDRFMSGKILISSGLSTGDLVVTDGVQLIRPGQRVTAVTGESQ
jgi:RND family efflux transporter MFP subunit